MSNAEFMLGKKARRKTRHFLSMARLQAFTKQFRGNIKKAKFPENNG